MALPEYYHIGGINVLPGAARLSFPYADTAYKKVQRVFRVANGSPLGVPGTDMDVEHTTCVLTEQEFLGHDAQYTDWLQIYETLPGPVFPVGSYDPETGAAIVTSRQRVLLPAATDAWTTSPDGNGLYVVDSTVTPESTVVGEKVTIKATLPDGYVEYQSQGFQFPAAFRFIGDWTEGQGPFLGVDYDLTQHRSSRAAAEVSNSFSVDAVAPAPEPTWAVVSPGSGSRFFPIGPNTIHGETVVVRTPSFGDPYLVEWFPESDPVSYTPGVTAPLISVEVTRWKGFIWRTRRVSVSEAPFIDSHPSYPNYPSTEDATPPV